MEAELRAFLRELHTEQQAKLHAQYIYTVKSRVLNFSGFWVCLYTRCAYKRDGLLFLY